MTASTDFLPFATGAGANVVSQALYAADTAVANGFSSGIASSAKFNKVFRQASFVAAGIANWIANTLNTNVPDDGNLTTFVANLATAVKVAATSGGFITDSGSVNALVGTSSPAPAALTAGLQVAIQVANTNTGAVTFNYGGLGVKAVLSEGNAVKAGQLVAGQIYLLMYDGTQWELLSVGLDVPATTGQAGIVALAANSDVVAGADTAKAVTSQGVAKAVQGGSYTYAGDSGSANAIVVALTPAPAAYSAGFAVEVRMNATNTGATTINVNGLGAKAVQFGGAALVAGQLVAGQIYCMIYDGTNFQLQSSSAPTIVAFSFGGSSGYIQWSNGFKIQVQDITVTTASSQTFSYVSAFNTWSRAWINGDDGNNDVSVYVTGTTASTATVRSATTGTAGCTLFSIGY
ncbi:hypothetical protein [Novosphingobium sp.]|uniref:hypothetical protein n=1 Tax=Novosphingobium sp. TaxID=1874826 RepID=UPI0038BBED37